LCLLFGDLDDDDTAKGIEANIVLPHEYPSADVPEIYVKPYKSSISRTRQSELNEALSSYIKENVIPGEVCLISVISWLQENGPKYILLSRDDEQLKTSQGNPNAKCVKVKTDSFIRFWIYSHHIYSKIKRRDILDLSREFQLTGFCMPGKPGIICMEGSENNCSEAWSVIKSWNWKKIHIKHQETGDFHNEAGVKLENIERFRRFTGFEEIGFVKNSDTRDYHMDMGEFSKYLEKNQSLYMFKALFGFDKAT